MTENIRIKSLDGVRGIAILLVLFYHTYLFSHIRSSHFADRVLTYLGKLSWSGVDLFFVLSGFLITRILLDSRDSPHYYKNFYIRRILRIFPLYYLYLILVFFVFSIFLLPVKLSFKDQAWYWFYLANYKCFFFRNNPVLLNHTWSLAIEEQFYLCWPIIVSLFVKNKLKRILIGIFIFSFLVRLVLSMFGYEFWFIRYIFFAKIDLLSAGALLAVLYRESKLNLKDRKTRINLVWILVSSLVLFALLKLLFHGGILLGSYLFTCVGILCSYFIILALHVSPGSFIGKILSSRLLTLFGKYSYSIYLFHLCIVLALCKFILPKLQIFIYSSSLLWLTLFVLESGITLFISWVTYTFYERYFLDFKDILASK